MTAMDKASDNARDVRSLKFLITVQDRRRSHRTREIMRGAAALRDPSPNNLG